MHFTKTLHNTINGYYFGLFRMRAFQGLGVGSLSRRKTCPCSIYPLEPYFYIVKLGYAGVYLFFLFLLQNIDCGYSLEPHRRVGSNVYPQSMFNVFEEKKRKYEKNLLKIFNFYNLIIKICILHGHVFVMSCFFTTGPGRIALSHSSFNLDEVLDEFQFYSDGKLLHPRRIMRKRIFEYAFLIVHSHFLNLKFQVSSLLV